MRPGCLFSLKAAGVGDPISVSRISACGFKRGPRYCRESGCMMVINHVGSAIGKDNAQTHQNFSINYSDPLLLDSSGLNLHRRGPSKIAKG